MGSSEPGAEAGLDDERGAELMGQVAELHKGRTTVVAETGKDGHEAGTVAVVLTDGAAPEGMPVPPL